jgi:hypothetical protein
MKPMLSALVLVLILIGLTAGSLIRSVDAQTDVVLFQVRQRLTLSYIDERSIDCTLLEICRSFERCEPPKPINTFNRGPSNVTTWYHLATVRSVSIREPQQ